MIGAFPGFSMLDFDRIRRGTIWKPRRWPWVDPLHDIQAATAAIEAKLTTRSRVIAEQSNEDFEDTIDELAEEADYITSKGLDPALTEKPLIANPTFPPTVPGSSGDPAASNRAGAPAIAALAPPEPAEPPARQHHSARQPRDRGRFAR
jgi:hypothetical protein